MTSPSSTPLARDSMVGLVLSLHPVTVLLHLGFLLGCLPRDSCSGTLSSWPSPPAVCCRRLQLMTFSSDPQRARAGSSLSSTASCMMRGPKREMTAPSSGSLRMWWPWALVTRGTSRDFSRYSQHPLVWLATSLMACTFDCCIVLSDLHGAAVGSGLRPCKGPVWDARGFPSRAGVARKNKCSPPCVRWCQLSLCRVRCQGWGFCVIRGHL